MYTMSQVRLDNLIETLKKNHMELVMVGDKLHFFEIMDESYDGWFIQVRMLPHQCFTGVAFFGNDGVAPHIQISFK